MIEKPEQGVASNEARATAAEPKVSALRDGIANAPTFYSLDARKLFCGNCGCAQWRHTYIPGSGFQCRVSEVGE